MRFGFLNNFSDQIAAPVSDTATSIELAGKASDIQAALQSADAVALTLFATDDQGNETQREVVYATAATPPLVTVTRAQEGTTAVAFGPGDGCEGRLTAASLSLFLSNTADDLTSICFGQNAQNTDNSTVVIGPNASSSGGRDGVIIGSGATTDDNDNVVIGPGASCIGGDDSVVIGEYATSLDNDNVVLGPSAISRGDNSVVIGEGAEGIGGDAVAIGESAKAGDSSVALGIDSSAVFAHGTALGDSAEIAKLDYRSDSEESCAIGYRTEVFSANSVSVHTSGRSLGHAHVSLGNEATVGKVEYVFNGDDIFIDADRATAIGSRSNVLSELGCAIGAYANVRETAPMGVAIGPGADVGVESGLRINGLSYLPRDFDGGNDSYGTGTFNLGWSPDEPLNPDGTPVDINAVPVIKDTGLSPEVHDVQLPIARRTALQSAISTNALNITDGAAVATLDLPANTILLIDAIDVVVVASDGAGGAPEIQIGPDDVTPASYLAATPVTKTAVGGRDTFTPLVTDGVTALQVSVASAGTGTTYSVKVVARGYVMEV